MQPIEEAAEIHLGNKRRRHEKKSTEAIEEAKVYSILENRGPKQLRSQDLINDNIINSKSIRPSFHIIF